MMSSTSTWSNADILRVSAGGTVIGFIEVGASTSLKSAREKIREELERDQFVFLLPDKVPVSLQQEQHILAREFLPMIFLKMPSESIQYSDNVAQSIATIPQDAKHFSNQITVTYLGEAYNVWVTREYTFAQLRREAARYWSLSPDHVILMDSQQCSFPECSLISVVVDNGMLQGSDIILMRKPGTNNASSEYEHSEYASPGGIGNITINNVVQTSIVSPRESTHFVFPANEVSKQNNPKSAESSLSRKSGIKRVPLVLTEEGSFYESEASPIGSRSRSFSECSSSRGRGMSIDSKSDNEGIRVSHRSIPKPPAPVNAVIERYAQLWSIFTFYCIQMDPTRPFTMDRRGLLALLQDCNLVDGKKLSPEIINLIYTSNCREGRQTNKMEFDDFLDAMMEVSQRVNYANVKKYLSPKNKSGKSKSHVMACFIHLLVHRILPHASSWKATCWERQSVQAASSPVLNTFQSFVKPLYEIFRFYAPAVPSNKLDMFCALGLRTYQIAEIFLSAVQFPGIHLVNKFGIGENEGNYDRIYQHSNGQPIWDKPVLFFENFLSAILRVAFFAFPDQVSNPEVAVKALFQHFSKCLRKSYVIEIIEKRRNVTTYPVGLMNGTNELYKCFTRLWQADGKPDYLSFKQIPLARPELTNMKGTIYAPESPRLVRTKSDTKKTDDESYGAGRQMLHELLLAEQEDTDSKVVSALLGKSLLEEGESQATHIESGDYLSFLDETAELQSPSDSFKFDFPTRSPRKNANSKSSAGAKERTSMEYESEVEEKESIPSVLNELSEITEIDDHRHSNVGHQIDFKNDQATITNSGFDETLKFLLCKGGIFLKHGRRGYPHRRFVWCDQSLTRVFWCPFDKRPTADSPKTVSQARSMLVQDIQEVLQGHKTDVFTKPKQSSWPLSRSQPQGGQHNICFSLVAGNRTLDLEADSPGAAQRWVNAFKQVLASK